MEPKKLPIRLVGLDLDGTVFDSQKRISPRTAQAIAQACAMGVQVLPATGRPENGVPAQFLAIPGVRYALTSNGARVVDLQEKRTVVSQLMTVQQGLEAVRAMGRYDASVDVFWQGKAYADPENLRRAAVFDVGPHGWRNRAKARRRSVCFLPRSPSGKRRRSRPRPWGWR